MDTTIFEQIKRINEHKQEYWRARDLYKALEYSEYRFFEPVVEKAKTACKNSGFPISDHFEDVHDMVLIGSGAKRKVQDINMSRYACYLAVQNADPTKEVVALAQTYFATQTRKQETRELLEEDGKRLFLREDIKEKNRILSGVAKSVGVFDYANFQDAGYMGLYGGLRQKDIKVKKKLKEKDNILDHMGSEELANNIFRAAQTSAKIRRENISGQHAAGLAHHEVGKEIRKTIQRLGGTMPENLPTPENIKESKKRIKTSLKKLGTKK